jgi:DNA-binding SARP family transcriptional activator
MAMRPIEFRILGPLQVLGDGQEIRVGAPRERALLSLLVMHAGEVVSRDRLFVGLWGESPPVSAAKTLQTYIAHVRRALDAGVPGARERLRTTDGGYRLDAADDEIDLRRFDRLLADGHAAVAAQRFEAASNAFADALALWRGPALSDLADDVIAAGEALRLEEARLGAMEGRIEAELGRGRHAEVVGQLQALVEQHPLREPLWGQLMRALYRCGRQAEALEAYRRAREVFVEELGIEPGPALQRLQLEILRQDEALEWRPLPDGDGSPAQTPGELLAEGRAAYERFDWVKAYDHLSHADGVEPLGPPDLERLAEAAWWSGRAPEAVAARERAYAAYTKWGDGVGAARVAVGLAEDHLHLSAPSVAQGWLARAERLLDGNEDCAERGHLWRVRTTIAFDFDGDPARALELAERTLAIGLACSDRDLQVLALQDRGRILVAQGDLAAGMLLIDEAMAAAAGAELGPYATGVAYCNTVITCESLADYARAAEWTEAMLRWCERHARSGFPGVCRVFQAEILRLRGRWQEALETARRAAAELEPIVPFYAGEAWYEVGETCRRAGDLDGAEEAYKRAHALGREPCPGLPLLRLDQRQVAAALSLIQEALADVSVGPLNRMRSLPAQVEIAIAAGDPALARVSVDEMQAIAGQFGSPVMRAACEQAEGIVLLAEGQARPACERLRGALRLWRAADLPYEAAYAQALLAGAYAAAGDEDRAALERDAAESTFERLGRATNRVPGGAPPG